MRNENLLASCAAQVRPSAPVNIVGTDVTARLPDGYLVNIAYIKSSDGGTCDESRRDAFQLRVVNDVLEEVTYVGPATVALKAVQPAAAASAAPSPLPG